MFSTISSKESLIISGDSKSTSEQLSNGNELGEYVFNGDAEPAEIPHEETESKKTISVGDSLPYGIRLYYGSSENIVRMRDIGVKRRILLMGVIGSFTPYCWNRHLFRVLQKSRYYEERDIDYICCISTNDPYTQRAWATYLGCDETVLMFSDTTTRYTQALGMDIVIPWLDNRIRSRRYLIYAEDMIVLKMIVAPNDGPLLKWYCEHLQQEENADDADISTAESSLWDLT